VIISHTELELLIKAEHSSPHDLLGMHPINLNGSDCLVVRVFVQNTQSCSVILKEDKNEEIFHLEKIHDLGFYEGILHKKEVFKYQLRVELGNGEVRQFSDPYSFIPTLSEEDTYLFNNGEGPFYLQKARCPSQNNPRSSWSLHGGLGSFSQESFCNRRLQSLGCKVSPDEDVRNLWSVGVVHPRFGGRNEIQI
jgi:1,4-alpha-glucan branching enzyme